MNLHQRFMLRYNKLNKKQRAELVLEFEGEPYTWNPIYIEVYNKTSLSHRLLAAMLKEGKL